jgi:hypothetical protein
MSGFLQVMYTIHLQPFPEIDWTLGCETFELFEQLRRARIYMFLQLDQRAHTISIGNIPSP